MLFELFISFLTLHIAF
jgi:hypothetical protein